MRRPSAFRSVVVPLDGSAFADQALPAAAAIARAARASVRLVLVHRLPPPPRDRDSAKKYVSVDLAVRRSQRDHLRSVAARLRRGYGLRVTALLVDGPAGPSLTKWIHDVDADLVVMTTHGRGAAGRAMYGSVADQLVRSVEVPVLLIRPAETDGTARHARWGIREITVGLDGSRHAETAVSPAATLARLFEVPLTLVQVILPVATMTDPPLPFPTGYDERITEVRRSEALDYLEDVAEPLRKAGLRVTTAAVLGASAAVTLIDLGRPERENLLAVATRGQGGVKRLMLGSVADKLVRGAAVPVLVVPRGRVG